MNVVRARRGIPYILSIFICVVVLILLVVWGVSSGTNKIPTKDVVNVIISKIIPIDYFDEYRSGSVHDVIWYIRLPRQIFAIVVGAGLAVAGVIMQAIVRNPLADPYVLGILSGASLGATSAIMLGMGAFLGGTFVGAMGCIGALLATMAVMIISKMGRDVSSIKLILAGMAVSTLCSALTSFIVYFSNDKEGIQTVTYWLMGSMAGVKWGNIMVITPIVIAIILFFSSQYRTLNLMLVGDEVAATLGKKLKTYRYIYLTFSSIMVGLIVYVCGTIGFVGLIIPHIARIIAGSNHKRLILLSSLLGSILLVLCDTLSRIIIPGAELPIGILVSMVGSPFFVYLMNKKEYGFGGAH